MKLIFALLFALLATWVYANPLIEVEDFNGEETTQEDDPVQDDDDECDDDDYYDHVCMDAHHTEAPDYTYLTDGLGTRSPQTSAQ